MRLKLWHHLTLSSLIALSCATAAWAHAEIFSEYSLDQAKQQAQKDNKLLLIDFTASWCPPCRKMESTTWADSAVKAWIKDNAIAVQIDVDKDRKSTSALKVEAMPTIVLFTPKSTTEFGRQVGYMGSSELLQWLDSAKRGKPAADAEKENEQAQSGGGGGADIWSRISGARGKLAAKQHAEALDDYVWLWTNITTADPTLADVRMSMVPHEMKQLVAVYPAAMTKFAEMRDASEKAENRQDWIILNGVLSDNARTLAWFDKVKNDPKQRATIEKQTKFLEAVLYSASRWSDAATYLYADPIAKVNDIYKRAQDMKKPRPDTEFAKDFDPFPSMVMLLYGAYVGAGREEDAKKIEAECLRLDDTPTMREGLSNMAKGMRTARAAATQGKVAKP